jgi:NADH:ubiquinone oxidoreductase subunit 5 (subunit L)/multisubunit Na+/H+ antiporter MnhA subunit
VTAGRASGSTRFFVVGLVGAFLTAAYMTRCVYLTFFGSTAATGHPHESEPLDHGAARDLAVFSILAGLLNAAPSASRSSRSGSIPPSCSRPSCTPTSTTAPRHLGVARDLGIGIAAYFWFQREELGRSRASRSATSSAHAGYTFLENKYYLDYLYEDVIVADQGADRPRRVLVQPERHRRVVNGCRARRRSRARSLRSRRPGGVDGAVNGVGASTGEAGGLLRYSSPVACSGTHCSCSRRWGCSASPCSSRTRPERGSFE